MRYLTVATSRVRLTAFIVGLFGLFAVPTALADGNATRGASVQINTAALTQSVLQEFNAVRKREGLPPATLTNDYTANVTNAALRNADPALGAFAPGAMTEYGLWGISTADPASNALNPSAIVDDWVYRDGWQGSATENLDCSSPTAAGCNGHRRAVLSSAPSPGAKLAVDIAIHQANWDGAPALSVAMLMVWSAPTAAPAPRTVGHFSLVSHHKH
ncbi:MAG TPA: hypothetical protein VG652_00605 [Gaiellaceae bacterium]|nr:hypothetical protein [Gaiellaceae bacterium]